MVRKYPEQLGPAGLLLLLLVALLAGCARFSSPEGGPYDMLPPVVVRTVPAQGATNVQSKRLRIYFDEHVKLERQSEKVIISPPQLLPPKMISLGRHIDITLEDPLIPNTTYTIDFGDAIVDNNEGNPLTGFVYAFSTGPIIDTMQISGVLLDARTLRPIEYALVGIYPKDDSLGFSSHPMMRMTRSAEKGSFALLNVHDGAYRVVALEDMDNNYYYSTPQERFAFSTQFYQTEVRWEEVALDSLAQAKDSIASATDSLPAWKQDSLRNEEKKVAEEVLATDSVPPTENPQKQLRYLPDDVVLLLNRSPKQPQQLNKAERTDSLSFQLLFNQVVDTLPNVRILQPEGWHRSPLYPQLSPEQNKIAFFLPPNGSPIPDSLQIEAFYSTTDSLGNWQKRCDTLTLHKPRVVNSPKKRTPNRPEGKTLSGGRSGLDSTATSSEADSLSTDERWTPLTITSSQGIFKGTTKDSLLFHFSEPVVKIDTARIKLLSVQDSLTSHPVPFRIGTLPLHSFSRQVLFSMEPGTRYLLQLDTGAVVGLSGAASGAAEYTLQLSALQDLGNIELQVSGLLHPEKAVVELLDATDYPLLTTTIENDTIRFSQLPPNTYYARLYVDLNSNGRWDGAVFPHTPPEPVYYYPKGLAAQAKFTTQEGWNVTAVPLPQQRPSELKSAENEDGQSSRRQRNEPRQRKNLNEEYIQRMRDRYGDRWNPSNRERKMLNLPSREEEAEQKAREQESERTKTQGKSSNP